VEGAVTRIPGRGAGSRRPVGEDPGRRRHDPPLPEPFEVLFASLEELRFTGPGTLFHHCFGCGPGHESGLRVRTFRDGDGVLAPIIVSRRFEGPRGCAHGGIVATYLDEVLSGAAVSHSGRLHVTGELAVRYVRPVPVERPLLGRGRAVREAPKYLELEGTLEDLGTGEILARATGRFFPLPDAR
jgi:acyl-coenzyme A thioesterase PaaI-like protein